MKNNSDQFRNDRIIQVMDHLITEKKVENQKDLAIKAKIQESTLSNIRNKIKRVSPRTINKICAAFPGYLNPLYMLANEPYMLMEDVIYYREHPEEDIFSDKYVPFDQREKVKTPKKDATGAIELYSQLIKELEDMRHQLSSELEDVRTVKAALDREREELKKQHELLSSITEQLTQCLLHTSTIYPTQEYSKLPMVAESTD